MFTSLVVFVAILALVFGAVCSDRDRFFAGLACTVVLVVASLYFAGVRGPEVIPFLLARWQEMLVGFAAYVVAGVPWAFVKWWRFAVLARRRLEDWLTTHPVPKKSTDHHDRLAMGSYAASVPGPIKFDLTSEKFVLLASEHKSRIVTWLAFWPLSILGTLVGDFLVRIWDNVYDAARHLLQRVADRQLADLNKQK